MTREDRLMLITTMVYSSSNEMLSNCSIDGAYIVAQEIERKVKELLMKEEVKKLEKK